MNVLLLSRPRMFLTIFTLSVCWTMVQSVSLISSNKDGGYEDIVVALTPKILKGVHDTNATIFQRLEELFNETSRLLHEATKNRLYFNKITFLFPLEANHELNSGLMNETTFQTYMGADFRVGDYKRDSFTDQLRDCGKPGEAIYINYKNLQSNSITDEARRLLQQWAKFRYGVFDENGQATSELYPDKYITPERTIRKTGCTNIEAWTPNECREEITECKFTPNKEILYSLMDDLELQASQFCNRTNHNKDSPTPHNAFCAGKSTWEMIETHSDYGAVGNADTERSINFYYVIGRRPKTFIIVDNALCAEPRLKTMIEMAVRKFIMKDDLIRARILVVNDKKITKLIPTAGNDFLNEFGSAMQDCKPTGSSLKDGIHKILPSLESNLEGDFVLLAKPGSLEQVIADKASRKPRQRIYGITFASPEEANNIKYEYIEESKSKWYNIPSLSTTFKCDVIAWKSLDNAFMDIFHHQQSVPDKEKTLLLHSKTYMEGNAEGEFYVTDKMSEICLTIHCCEHCNATLAVTIDEDSPKVRENSTDNVQEICSVSRGRHSYRIESTVNVQPFFLTIHSEANEASVDQLTNIRVVVDRFKPPESENATDAKDAVFVVRAIVRNNDETVIQANVAAVLQKLGMVDQVFTLRDNGNGDPDIFKNDGIYSSYVIPRVEGVYDVRVEVKLESDAPIIFNGGSVQFDSNLETLARILPPNRIVDLKVEDVSQNSVYFSLTAPGEVLDQRKAAEYVTVTCKVASSPNPSNCDFVVNGTLASSFPGVKETLQIPLKCPDQVYKCTARARNKAHMQSRPSNVVLVSGNTTAGEHNTTAAPLPETGETTPSVSGTISPLTETIIIGCSVSISALLLILIIVLLVINREKLPCRRNPSPDGQRDTSTNSRPAPKTDTRPAPKTDTRPVPTNGPSATGAGDQRHSRLRFLNGKTKTTATPASKTELPNLDAGHRNSDVDGDVYMDPESLSAASKKGPPPPVLALHNRPPLPAPMAGEAYDEVGNAPSRNPRGKLPPLPDNAPKR